LAEEAVRLASAEVLEDGIVFWEAADAMPALEIDRGALLEEAEGVLATAGAEGLCGSSGGRCGPVP
jgi:hypothetical protein